MGSSLSWVAVRGKPTEAVYAQLGVRGTGQREEIPESPVVGANLPGGWSLVVADHDEALAGDFILMGLSSGCDAVACFVEEHVMFSTATEWKDGQKVWSIFHDAQQGIEHLDAQGDLPSVFAAIRDRLRSAQQAAGGKKADVDHVFDVPVEVAEALTGYRHDKDVPGNGEDPFEVLSGALSKPEKKSWLKRFFGG